MSPRKNSAIRPQPDQHRDIVTQNEGDLPGAGDEFSIPDPVFVQLKTADDRLLWVHPQHVTSISQYRGRATVRTVDGVSFDVAGKAELVVEVIESAMQPLSTPAALDTIPEGLIQDLIFEPEFESVVHRQIEEMASEIIKLLPPAEPVDLATVFADPRLGEAIAAQVKAIFESGDDKDDKAKAKKPDADASQTKE